MQQLQQKFEEAKAKPSDINEHLDTLYHYAALSETIVEFGCRWGVSTTALLYAKPKKLVSYDLEIYPQINELAKIAATELPETEFIFRDESTLYANPPECDLLFLDSYHVYEQVLVELVFHANRAKKFMVFHDTETFKDKGQTDGYQGIGDAIEGFLRYHPEWVLIEERKNNNGLLVMAKNQRPIKFWEIGRT